MKKKKKREKTLRKKGKEKIENRYEVKKRKKKKTVYWQKEEIGSWMWNREIKEQKLRERKLNKIEEILLITHEDKWRKIKKE